MENKTIGFSIDAHSIDFKGKGGCSWLELNCLTIVASRAENRLCHRLETVFTMLVEKNMGQVMSRSFASPRRASH